MNFSNSNYLTIQRIASHIFPLNSRHLNTHTHELQTSPASAADTSPSTDRARRRVSAASLHTRAALNRTPPSTRSCRARLRWSRSRAGRRAGGGRRRRARCGRRTAAHLALRAPREYGTMRCPRAVLSPSRASPLSVSVSAGLGRERWRLSRGSSCSPFGRRVAEDGVSTRHLECEQAMGVQKDGKL